MDGFRPSTVAVSLSMMVLLSGCGFTPPKLAEGWEAQDVSDDMVYNIKANIFCETIKAIRATNRVKTGVGVPIPDDYGVQLQLTLSVAESTSFSPTGSYTHTLRNGTQSGLSIGRNFGFGLTATASSTATRTDTTYTYWRVGGIAASGKNKFCDQDSAVDRKGSSFLVKSDLGIARFLKDNVKASDLIHSSTSGQKKPDKVDVYSYDLKFAVVTSGGVNGSFKLVSLSGAGSPIFDLSRTRTHELLLTFGPTGPDGFKPSDISFGQHLNSELNSTLSRVPSGP
jgi:hypothetical protein